MSSTPGTIQTRPTLQADTAADLMSPNPISLRREATVFEAIQLMLERNFDSTPVIDERGQPVGVVTITDILIHSRENVRYLKSGKDALQQDSVDRTRIEDIMTPLVFTVEMNTPVTEVLQKLLSLKIHHLFVRDGNGTLVGVISTGDILRRLG